MNKEKIQAVLFDLDDTLWPIGPTIKRAETILFEWLGANAPRLVEMHSIDSLRARRMALMDSVPRYRFELWALRHASLREALEAAGEDPIIAQAAMEVFSRERNVVTLFEDVEPGLLHLGQHFRLGSISNGFADLEAIGLARHFGVSIAAHRMGYAKPDPRIFHHACAELGVEPNHTLYVGDDLQLDVEGAQQAGLQAVWMNRFEREPAAGIAPDFVCTNLHELIRHLVA